MFSLQLITIAPLDDLHFLTATISLAKLMLSSLKNTLVCSQMLGYTVLPDLSFVRLFGSILQEISNFKNSKYFNRVWKALARCNRNKRLTSGIPTSGLFPELRIGFRNPDVARQHPAVISGKPEVPTMYNHKNAQIVV